MGPYRAASIFEFPDQAHDHYGIFDARSFTQEAAWNPDLLACARVDHQDFRPGSFAVLPLVVLNVEDGRIEGKRSVAERFERRRNRRGHASKILC